MKSNTTATLLQHFWMVLKGESKYAMNYVYKHLCRNWYKERKLKKLYLNTVLKIFIRQYRTRAGNHCNSVFYNYFWKCSRICTFSKCFFFLILSGSFSPWSINIPCNDSDAKQRLNPSKTPCFWREIVAAANSLHPRKQTNYADLKKTKSCFFVRSSPAFVNRYFHPYLW